jgi:hypothetical protein
MKKQFKISAIIILAVSLFTFIYSCNEKEEACETCINNFSDSKLNFYGSEFNFKKRSNANKNYTILYTSCENKEILNEFYADLLNFYKIKIDPINTVSLTVISNQSYESNTNLKFNDINGLICYTKNNENSLVLKIYKFINGKLQESSLSNSITNKISLTDEYDISYILFKNNFKTLISFIDFKNLPLENNNVTNLDKNLENEYKNIGNIRKPAVCDGCGETNTKGDCEPVYDENGNYTGYMECSPDYCSSDDVEKRLKEAHINNYNFVQIKEDLHSFRDTFLKTHTGGNKIIKTYYKLSQKLPIQNMTLDQSIKTFNLIVSDVIPLVNQLKTNPSSGQILIDNDTNSKLIQYLYEIKQIYPDIDSKNRIQNLINKLNHFTNKSNSFITNNLNDF